MQLALVPNPLGGSAAHKALPSVSATLGSDSAAGAFGGTDSQQKKYASAGQFWEDIGAACHFKVGECSALGSNSAPTCFSPNLLHLQPASVRTSSKLNKWGAVISREEWWRSVFYRGGLVVAGRH